MGAGHETTATTAAAAIYAGGCTAWGCLGAAAILKGRLRAHAQKPASAARNSGRTPGTCLPRPTWHTPA